MARVLLIFVFLIIILSGTFAQTTTEGKVTDSKNGEPIHAG